MYGYGYPPPFWGPPITAPMNEEAVTLAKQVLKAHKAEKKRKAAEEKKKDDKAKPKLFTFLELTGAVFLCSPLVILAQMYLLAWAQQMMNNLVNTPH